MMTRAHSTGFSLIELMVAITILGLLIMFGASSYSTWIANTRIRNAAESIQNGLRLARTQAIQRARPVRFELGSAAADWTVCVTAATTPSTCTGATETIQVQSAGDGVTGVRVGGSKDAGVDATTDVSANSAAGAGVTFSALGRAVAGTSPLTKIDASTTRTDTRRLVMLIASGGSVRMCDPSLSLSVSPQGCAQ